MSINLSDNVVGFTFIQETIPENPSIGDSWYDPFFEEAYFWNGFMWILLGLSFGP